MKSKKKPSVMQIPINLLLLGVISALFVLFVFMLNQRPSQDYFPTNSVKTVAQPQKVMSQKDLDMLMQSTSNDDTTSQINTEMQKLSSDASGI